MCGVTQDSVSNVCLVPPQLLVAWAHPEDYWGVPVVKTYSAFSVVPSDDLTIAHDPSDSAGQLIGQHSVTFQHKTYSRMELLRCDSVNALHEALGHPSDKVLCAAFHHYLTSKDVRNNSLLRGPCPHCLAGKHRKLPMRPSLSDPPSSIGQVVSTDLQKLPCPTKMGCTHQSVLVDAMTGYIDIVLHKSKHNNHVFAGLKKTIITTYNKNGHRVRAIHSDSENIYKALSTSFHEVGIDTFFSPPEQHAQLAERYYQTLKYKMAAVLSSLSFHVPLEFLVYLAKEVAFCMNHLPNTLTHPLTPSILMTGKKSRLNVKYPFLKFATVCMVENSEAKDKRDNLLALGHAVPSGFKMELGVCLGHCPLDSACYIFVLGNGSVVSRGVFTPVNARPWSWPLRYSPRSEIILPSPPHVTRVVQSGIDMDDSRNNIVDDTILESSFDGSTSVFLTPNGSVIDPVVSSTSTSSLPPVPVISSLVVEPFVSNTLSIVPSASAVGSDDGSVSGNDDDTISDVQSHDNDPLFLDSSKILVKFLN